jgi:hypothetical protein
MLLVLHQYVKSNFMLIGTFQTSGSQPRFRDKPLNKSFKILQNIPNIPPNIEGIFFRPLAVLEYYPYATNLLLVCWSLKDFIGRSSSEYKKLF